uniref:Uncharacterized protein n=1 Tax=uncultured marine virus TaxID=186617 RepID=A0A0F7L3Z1_9VIRU|nr:hypothetical protein [uncultured marine virus]
MFLFFLRNSLESFFKNRKTLKGKTLSRLKKIRALCLSYNLVFEDNARLNVAELFKRECPLYFKSYFHFSVLLRN